MNSTVLNKQWSTRPNDQRFLTMQSLYNAVLRRKTESFDTDAIACKHMQLRSSVDGHGIEIADLGVLNHWSFGQLCQRVKAQASYLRTLPAEIAVIPLQWSIEHRDEIDADDDGCKVLVRRPKIGSPYVRAITSPTYGRIYDADVVKAITDNIDLTVWKVPSASYSARDPLRATTLYASDRDVFIFLVNEETALDVKGERINRGFYVVNSEVGAAKFLIATFTYDYVCDNRIIWGMGEFTEIGIKHTSGGPQRFIRDAVPMIQKYAESSASRVSATIRQAKVKELGDDKDSVVSWLRDRGFTSQVAKQAYDAAEKDPRNYNPRSVWGVVQGLTDVAHTIPYANERVALEKQAGKILEYVA